MKKKVLTRVIAIALVVMTVFSTMAMSFTASAESKIVERMAKALISTTVGHIPVIGSGIAQALDPVLLSALGLNPTDKILAKLDEISKQIEGLELKMDAETQKILEAIYEAKLEGFNADMTALKEAVTKLYNRLTIIEENSTYEYEKEILTAELLNFDYRYTDDIIVTAGKLAKYVEGTQFKTEDEAGIYEHVYKTMCTRSIIGGEAGLRASAYVNEVNNVLSNAYKLMTIVLAEKVYVADNMKKIDAACESNPDFKDSISGYNLALYRNGVNRAEWASLLGSETTGYAAEYGRIFDTENENSVVYKYNKMVKDNWFSYIRSTKYEAGKMTVNFIALNPEMKATTPEECGLDRKESGRYDSKYMAERVSKNINAKITSALTKDEVKKLYTLIATNDAFCKDDNGNKLNLVTALRQYGFIISSTYETGTTPLCTTNATYGSHDVDNSTTRYWDETANFDGFNGLGIGLAKLDIQYYHYRQYQGCNYKENGCQTPYALLYFAAA